MKSCVSTVSLLDKIRPYLGVKDAIKIETKKNSSRCKVFAHLKKQVKKPEKKPSPSRLRTYLVAVVVGRLTRRRGRGDGRDARRRALSDTGSRRDGGDAARAEGDSAREHGCC